MQGEKNAGFIFHREPKVHEKGEIA